MGRIVQIPFNVSSDVPKRRCEPPKIHRYLIDFTSTLPFYDELGMPKLYAPTRLNENGEWLYALSPKRNLPPLKDAELSAHLQEIEAIRHPPMHYRRVA